MGELDNRGYPSTSQIREELKRIFGSKGFSKAPLQQRLLELIVQSTINGDVIKESVLANEIGLKDYDQSKHSLVRGRVSAIRKNLTKYYAKAKNSQVRISIPPNSFDAKFEWSDTSKDEPAEPTAVPPSTDPLIQDADPLSHRKIATNQLPGAQAIASTTILLTLLIAFGPLTAAGHFTSATIVLFFAAVTLTFMLATLRHSRPARVGFSILMIGMMAYFPSGWTLNRVMETVVNIDVLPPAASYPFITGLKFIPLFIPIFVFWIVLAFHDDAGFSEHPTLGKTYGIFSGLILVAWLMAGWATDDYNIWSQGSPGRWTVVIGYLIVLLCNLAISFFGYWFFRRKAITSYKNLFNVCLIAYFIVGISGSWVDSEYNNINECCLDRRHPDTYSADVRGLTALSTISSPEIGPRLRAMLRDPTFIELLNTVDFYRQPFDQSFLTNGAALFGFRDPSSSANSPRFEVIRFPKALLDVIRFRRRDDTAKRPMKP